MFISGAFSVGRRLLSAAGSAAFFCTASLHSAPTTPIPPCLIHIGVEIFGKSWKEGLRFSPKTGGGVFNITRLSIEVGKHRLSLITYRLCSSNALYPERLSVRMFILILNPFDTSILLLFWIESHQSQRSAAYKSIFHKKHVTLFFSLLKMNK